MSNYIIIQLKCAAILYAFIKVVKLQIKISNNLISYNIVMIYTNKIVS